MLTIVLQRTTNAEFVSLNVVFNLNYNFFNKVRGSSAWVKKEFKMVMIKESKEGKQSIIPVRIKKGGSIPLEIGEKAYADFTTAKRWVKNLPKLCKALGI